jgi:hypothetical protein
MPHSSGAHTRSVLYKQAKTFSNLHSECTGPYKYNPGRLIHCQYACNLLHCLFLSLSSLQMAETAYACRQAHEQIGIFKCVPVQLYP